LLDSGDLANQPEAVPGSNDLHDDVERTGNETRDSLRRDITRPRKQ
jgi:hypothetical protein